MVQLPTDIISFSFYPSQIGISREFDEVESNDYTICLGLEICLPHVASHLARTVASLQHEKGIFIIMNYCLSWDMSKRLIHS